MYSSEVPAIGWLHLVVVVVVFLALLGLFVWWLWRFDVRHEGDFRLPKSLEPRIREFVRAVDEWDFDAAETAVTRAFWSAVSENAPARPQEP